MAATIPDRIPETFAAGDTVKWYHAESDYLPADGWSLSYEFVGASVDLGTITGVTSGARWLVTIAKATSATFTAGVYTWNAFAWDEDERWRVGTGTVTIEANLGTVSTFDGRSHVKTVLDALEALLEGKASKDQASYSIAGRSLTAMGIDELIAWREKYRGLYIAELRKKRVADGLSHNGVIRSQF